MENEILVLKKSDLQSAIRDEIAKVMDTIASNGTEDNHKEFLSLRKGVEYINNKGLKISISGIYKKTSENDIPFLRWGGKKIVFVEKDLDKWIEEQLSGKNTNKVAKAVADAASRKVNRA